MFPVSLENGRFVSTNAQVLINEILISILLSYLSSYTSQDRLSLILLSCLLILSKCI